jgi:catechol 2,3-dioxygenase
MGPLQREVAVAGSYGEVPPGYRLPEALRLGSVVLMVSDLTRSVLFYERVLGMRVLEQTESHARLGAHMGQEALLELRTAPGIQPRTGQPRLGLFHFALLLPDRASLGRFVRHLNELGVRAGAGDHFVSEAFYLDDPDGLGIEIYADRPRSEWWRVGRELVMGTDPVDVAGLVAAAGPMPWVGMPSGTVMGHLHLHVGDLARGAAFYADAIGFDRMVWSYPGALFFGAGGYHHHLGTNIWAGSGALAPPPNEARLLEWSMVLPSAADVDAVAASLERARHAIQRDPADGAFRVADPWGTTLRVSAP